jgi:hypothetical protein
VLPLHHPAIGGPRGNWGAVCDALTICRSIIIAPLARFRKTA